MEEIENAVELFGIWRGVLWLGFAWLTDVQKGTQLVSSAAVLFVQWVEELCSVNL